MIDIDGGRYNPVTDCCLCGYPKSVHRGVDWTWQDEGLARHVIDPAGIPKAVLTECKRLMDAEVALFEREATEAARDAADAEAAALANRLYEEGAL